MGYQIVSTTGTRGALIEKEIPSELVFKLGEGRPDVCDLIRNHEIKLVVNTPSGNLTIFSA